MSRTEVPQPTELIQVPSTSYLPLFLALSVATLLIGLFFGMFVAFIGLVLTVATVGSWIKLAASDLDRQPRLQTTSTSVIPAEPLRRS